MRKLLTAAASTCALAVFAVPAQATAPNVVESSVNRTVTIAASPDTCAFPIVAHLEGGRRVTTFFDGDGNVVRRTVLLQSFTITYTNPLSGKSLSTPLAGPVIGEPQADGRWLVTIPETTAGSSLAARATSSRTSASASASRTTPCR